MKEKELISLVSRFTAEYICHGFDRKEAADLWGPIKEHYKELTKLITEQKPKTIFRTEIGLAWDIYECLMHDPHKFSQAEEDCYLILTDFFEVMSDDAWFQDGYDVFRDSVSADAKHN